MRSTKETRPRHSDLEREAARFLRSNGLRWNGAKKKSKSVRLAFGQGRG